jgi:hypothetical protein
LEEKNMTSSQTPAGIQTLEQTVGTPGTAQTSVRADELIGNSKAPVWTGTINHDGKEYPWKGMLHGFSLFGGGKHGTYLWKVQAPCTDVSVYNATPDKQRELAGIIRNHYESLYASVVRDSEEHHRRGEHP